MPIMMMNNDLSMSDASDATGEYVCSSPLPGRTEAQMPFRLEEEYDKIISQNDD